MEYTKVVAGPNGGTVVPMTEQEIAELVASQEAAANQPPTMGQLIEMAKAAIMSLPVSSRDAHYTEISQILAALSQGDIELATYKLENKITPQNETETQVLSQVKALFGLK